MFKHAETMEATMMGATLLADLLVWRTEGSMAGVQAASLPACCSPCTWLHVNSSGIRLIWVQS